MENKISCMSFEDFKNISKTRPQWQRVEEKGTEDLLPNISFQLFDATPCLDSQICSLLGTCDETVSSLSVDRIRLYGVTENGLPICVNVHGYFSYFYTSVPPTFSLDDLNNFKDLVNEKYSKEFKYEFNIITSIDKTELQALPVGSTHSLIKCYLREVRSLKSVIKIMKEEMKLLMSDFDLCVFEDELTLVEKFCMDREIKGCSWLSIQSDKYTVVAPEVKQSTCQLEVNVSYLNVVCVDSDEKNQLRFAAPRLLGFDIECFVRRNCFSDYSIDPVIAVGCIIRDGYRKTDSQFKVIFVLGSCIEVEGADVFCFNSEEELLQSWEYFVMITDPDFLIGYNILGFDFQYLMSRGKELKIEGFGNFGRFVELPEADSLYYRYNVCGRVVLDLLPITKNECPNLSSYALASVIKTLLNESKYDLDVKCMGQLHEGTDSDRGRIASYCLKDTLFLLQLMDHLSIFEKCTQSAFVSSLLLTSVAENNNKSFDLLSMPLIQTAHQYGCTIGKSSVRLETNLPRVATPETLTLFACIIMEYNLCFRTYIPKEKARDLPGNTINKTPCGNYFLTKENGKGIIPFTIAKLLGQIQTVRIQIKKQKDSGKLRVLYCRLKALKNALRVLCVMLQSPHSSYYFLPIHAALYSYSETLRREEKVRLINKYFI